MEKPSVSLAAAPEGLLFPGLFGGEAIVVVGLSNLEFLECAAFVHHLFARIGLSLVPHVTYLLERETRPRPLARLKAWVHRRLRAHVRQVRI